MSAAPVGGQHRWWALLPAALVAVVAGADAVLGTGPRGILVTGAVDEPAHLATAALLLLALAGPRRLLARPRETAAALAAAVLVDLDHVPLYAGVPHVAVDGGRPVTHSLTTVAVLLVVARLLPTAGRRLAGAAALGVGLHLVRDLATGPGAPLAWPVLGHSVVAPYAVYAAVVLLAAATATGRILGAVAPRRARSG